MADEDDDEDYTSGVGKLSVQNTKTANSTRVVANTVSTSTATKIKYGPPREIRLRKQNRCILFSNRFQKIKKFSLPQNKLDENNIEQTFSWLNFKLEKHINLDYNSTQEKIADISKYDYSNDECLVWFFITHGTKEKRLYANDMVKYSLDDVLQTLTDTPTLHGKPKLVFVQACRGSEAMEAVVDESDGSDFVTAGVKKRKAKDADMFVYFSTTEGYLAWGNQNVGSYFINTLCGVLQEYGGDYHLAEVVAKVNEVLAENVRHNKSTNRDVVEVGDVNHSLTSKLYFNPSGSYEEESHGELVKQSTNVDNGRDERSKKRTVVKISTRK